MSYHEGLKKSVKDFCKNSSLTGYKYTVKENVNTFERTFWICIHILSIICVVYMTLALWNRFADNPIVTVLESSNYPVKFVDFPAVSICDLNKISKWKAQQLAIDIANLTRRDVNFIIKKMNLLGNLFDYDMYYTAEEMLEFQTILEDYNEKIVPKKMGIFDLMYKISPSCGDFIKVCSWGGIERNCGELFKKRITFEGFCCTFNYLKATIENISFENYEKYKQKAGVNNGLNVILQFNLTDYFYTMLSSAGGMIHVFNPNDYPDYASGSLKEKMFGVNDEVFLTVTPTTLIGMHDILSHSVSKRECIFKFERKTVLGDYSESDCVVDCRIQSMRNLCECVSFLFPLNTDPGDICTLADIQCLSKYKAKWTRMYPYDQKNFIALQREKEDSLLCENRCYSTCEATLYEVLSSTYPLSSNSFLSLSKNASVVHIYYQSPISEIFKKDVVFYWFEILGTFGGMSSLIFGVSAISLMEVLLCFTYKFIYYTKFEDTKPL